MQTHHKILWTVGFLAMLWATFWLWIILLFEGQEWANLIAPILIISYIIMWMMYARHGFKSKGVYLPLATILAIWIGCFVFFKQQEAYHRIPTVQEANENYEDRYSPFYETSPIARLDEPSTLNLTDNLPSMDGSTALYPLYSAFFASVYPKDLDDYETVVEKKLIITSKTGNAYERLLNKEVDIIFVPEPSKEHRAKAQSLGVEFHLTPIGKEAFVFFVNHKNPVNELSNEQIRQIYSGKITNWQQVGGQDDAIRAFQRPENSGSQTALQKIMGDTPLMVASREDVAEGMGGMINEVASYRNFENALGYSFLFFATEMVKADQIKLLKINGIEPNHENILNESYPYTAPFYAVTLGNESDETRALLDWIISPQGQTLVQKTGYVPIYPVIEQNTPKNAPKTAQK